MQEQNPKLEELVQAVCWKLYLEPDSRPLKEKWQEFAGSNSYRQQAGKICDSLADIWKRLFASRLEMTNEQATAEDKKLESLWLAWLEWLSEERPSQSFQKNKQIYHYIVEIFRIAIREALSPSSVELFPLEKSPKQGNQSEQENNTSREALEQTKVANSDNLSSHQTQFSVKTKITDSGAGASPEIPPGKPSGEASRPSSDRAEQPSEPENQQLPPDESSTPAVAQWKYLPVPDNEPDKHEEEYCKSDKTPEGLKLIGARVRGKMHKHNGTNCDDWFEFAVSGNWTIIAVSDGAGSKKFSRVGAKVSCEAAVKSLADDLKSYKMLERDTKEKLSLALRRDDNWAFAGKDIKFVQEALYKAMKAAYDAVQEKANKYQELAAYYKALGNRELDIKDLSATLLLAVHTSVKAGGTEYSLILTCQIGDGMLAAISQEGKLQLLGKPDSGEFAGQTEFLTSKNKIERENLIQKTFIFPGHLKTLMVMTDGVADDYFPNEPGMLRLYGDLVLNQVINIPKPSNSEINKELEKTNLRNLDGIREATSTFQVPEQALAKDGVKEVKISYIDAYAQDLGISPQDVVASPALLSAGASGEPMCDECKNKPPEEKLQVWLDSYYRRSSFDDRTLVVLYREEV